MVYDISDELTAMIKNLINKSLENEGEDERRMARVLLGILAFLAIGVVFLNLSPPHIAPWWDCRVGFMSKNMETRIRLLTSCLQDGDLSASNKALSAATPLP